MTINNCLKHAPPEGMGSKHWALGKNANKITTKKKTKKAAMNNNGNNSKNICMYVYMYKVVEKID